MAHVLYCSAKTLRMRIRSLYETSRGSSSTYLKNVAQLVQVPSVAKYMLVERPSDIQSVVNQKLLRKRVQLDGSIYNRAYSTGRVCPCR